MREIIHINFDWFFNLKYTDEHISNYRDVNGFSKVDIPHNNLELEINYLKENINEVISTYKKFIYIKKEYFGKIINLVFEGIAHASNIYINDKFILRHEGGYDEFKVDISKFVEYDSENLITVIVDNHENKDIPPFGNVVDYLGYGGIYREVELEVLDNEHIDSCFLKCLNLESQLLTCTVTSSVTYGELEIIIRNQDNQIVFDNKYQINGTISTLQCKLDKINLWKLDDPYLYNVHVRLIQNNVIFDEIKTRFGFREILFTKSGFYLNKEHIKLRGLNRHQSYPYVGYAMPKSAQEKDAEILKYDLGVNIVRTSHYMQSKHFLNRCDEIGLLVFEEIPGWQYIGTDKFIENSLNNVKAMITRDYNHPSIVLWGVRINESYDDDEFYKKTNEIAHQLDNSRPTGGVRNFMNSNMFEDVYTFNDFYHSGGVEILRKPDKVKKNVPYLVTEFNGHMFPTKRFDDEPHRIEHALRHYRVINDATNSDRYSGTIGWCMNDYNTHKEFGSGDKICYHGVLDMFRLPKYASYIYSAQQDNNPVLEVLSTLNNGDYPASVIDKVYVATNCDYIKLYRNNEYIKTFYPDKNSRLKHPLVIVDDLIGSQLEEKHGFSKKDSERAKKLFFAVSKYAYNLPLKYKFYMLLIMKKYKLKLSQAIDLYYKYSTGIACYCFEGFIDEKSVKKVIKEYVKEVSYQLILDKKELIVDKTYDVTRVVVSKVDQNGNILPYSFDAINVTVSGGIDIIGPSNISLIAGQAAFWVRTNQTNETGQISVRINELVLTETVNVKRG